MVVVRSSVDPNFRAPVGLNWPYVAQFYLSCGQINVTGGGSGKPGPLVAIPGVYTGNVGYWSAFLVMRYSSVIDGE